MTEQKVRHIDPGKHDDALGTTARTIKFPTTMDEQLTEAGEEHFGGGRSLSWVVRRACIDLLQRLEHDKARVDRPDAPDVFALMPIITDGGDVESRRRALVIDGVTVPHVTVFELDDDGVRSYGLEPDGEPRYALDLDNRYLSRLYTKGELWQDAWFWANAMAIAAGFTSHGQNSRRINPHGPLEKWAAEGWETMDASGSSGRGYDLDVRFHLPNVDQGDQVAHELRDAVVRLVSEMGARDVLTSLLAVAPIEEDRRLASPGGAPMVTVTMSDGSTTVSGASTGSWASQSAPVSRPGETIE